MPSDSNASKLPAEALDAFLDGVLAELRAPTDPAALDQVRAAFRRRVPFSLRSYAAAALILRAAGLSRGPARPAPVKEGPVVRDRKARDDRAKEPKAKKTARDANRPKTSGERPAGESRPRLAGEGTTLFFSMGKRQRLYPHALIDLIVEGARLAPDEVGDVRTFDNYSFADVIPSKAAAVVAALDGSEFRGRRLSVSPAKKREGVGDSD